jgi:hypothetical protein
MRWAIRVLAIVLLLAWIAEFVAAVRFEVQRRPSDPEGVVFAVSLAFYALPLLALVLSVLTAVHASRRRLAGWRTLFLLLIALCLAGPVAAILVLSTFGLQGGLAVIALGVSPVLAPTLALIYSLLPISQPAYLKATAPIT